MARRRPSLIALGLALLGLVLSLPAAAIHRGETLELGVFPNLSPRMLVSMYQPLRLALEKELGRPVQVYTAPGLKAFYERTRSGEYDLIVTPPHLARLAQTESGFVPLVSYAAELRGLVVVPKQSSVATLADLRGRMVAMPDRLGIISMLGLQAFRNAGLEPGTDFSLFYAQSHSNAALAVRNGQADAAVIGTIPLAQLPQPLRGSLRVVAVSPVVPSQFYLANPRLGPGGIEAVRRALAKFAATPEGKTFFRKNGFGGFRPAREDGLRKVEPFAREAKRLLEEPK